ncbi:hypothetical protein U1Q18_013809 [Sarracenia purpurea var. burkii]
MIILSCGLDGACFAGCIMGIVLIWVECVLLLHCSIWSVVWLVHLQPCLGDGAMVLVWLCNAMFGCTMALAISAILAMDVSSALV